MKHTEEEFIYLCCRSRYSLQPRLTVVVCVCLFAKKMNN